MSVGQPHLAAQRGNTLTPAYEDLCALCERAALSVELSVDVRTHKRTTQERAAGIVPGRKWARLKVTAQADRKLEIASVPLSANGDTLGVAAFALIPCVRAVL